MGKKHILTDDEKWGYLLVAPTIIGLIVLNVYPFIQTLVLSFSTTHPFGIYEVTGIQNYEQMFASKEFWKATWNSIYFCILTVPIGVFLSLLAAVLLNAKIKGKSAFRAIYFLPMVVAPAAIAMVWKWIFNAEYGIINQIIGTKVSWLTTPGLVLPACAVVAIWSAVGYDAILLLSGIQNISKSYYEAASLDGASTFQIFRYITVPLLNPVIQFVVITSTIGGWQLFAEAQMLVGTAGGIGKSGMTVVLYLYNQAFGNRQFGYGSAISWALVVIIGFCSLINWLLTRREVD